MKPNRCIFRRLSAPLGLVLQLVGLAALAPLVQPGFTLGLAASLAGALALWLSVLLLARKAG